MATKKVKEEEHLQNNQKIEENKAVHAEKAAQVAKNYDVTVVWCTADGTFWATSEERKNRLPKNRGAIYEYSFVGDENPPQ